MTLTKVQKDKERREDNEQKGCMQIRDTQNLIDLFIPKGPFNNEISIGAKFEDSGPCIGSPT